MTVDKPITNTSIIQSLIQNNNRSRKLTEINYFDSNNEVICSKEKNEFTQTYIIPNNFYADICRQTSNYVVGKPVTIGNLKNEVINPNDFLVELTTNCCKHGLAWLYLYVENDKLKYKVINDYEIIPIWDTNFQDELIQLIRYYNVEVIDNTNTSIRKRVEVWDSEKVIYYIENEKGILNLDLIFTNESVQYHINNTSYILDNAIKTVGKGWGMIPFIPLKLNSECKSELTTGLKAMIDGYDSLLSNNMDNLEAIQNALLLIKDRSAEEYNDLMFKIKKYKCLKVDDTGDAKYLTVDIPFDGISDMMTKLENNIYKFARAVNIDDLTRGGGQLTNAFIETLFFKLNQKGNEFIKQINEFLASFYRFINIYNVMIGKPLEIVDELTFDYNLSIPSNVIEIIESVNSCKGIISDKTLLSKHPLVDNVDDEILLIEEDEQQFLQSEELKQNDTSIGDNEDIPNNGITNVEDD